MDEHKGHLKLVNPNNKRKFTILVVGSGLAGASAAASFAELGYEVKCFCFQDSPRRAHSIAAQGGINAAKNYHNDGDSVFRLFYDTIKGGDFRSREANVYRLAQVSVNIIDQCVAQGVPFAPRVRRPARQPLLRRRPGGPHLLRPRPDRPAAPARRLPGPGEGDRQRQSEDVPAYRDARRGARRQGSCRRHHHPRPGDRRHRASRRHAVVLATGGYSNVYYLSTNAKGSNVTAAWRAHRRGALFSNACFTQIHPTCIPASGDYQSKLTLMSESLRNDGRIWVPKNPSDTRSPDQIPESDRDYYLEVKYPSFGNLVPRDVAARNAKQQVDAGRGVGPQKNGVYLDFKDAIARVGKATIEERYGNLFEMYDKITGENPYVVPMRIYPAPHYTMGGLWVDYDLMTNLTGLYAIGEANFSDHGANRLGASALMQGLADGYFVIPYTIGNYLSGHLGQALSTETDAFRATEADVKDRLQKLLSIKGKRTADSFQP